MTEVHYYEKMLQEDINCGIGTANKKNPGGGTLVGTQVGIHTLAIGQAAFVANWVPGVIQSLTSVSVAVSTQGAVVGDFVIVSLSRALSGLILWGEVSGAGAVTVRLFNPTASLITIGVDQGTPVLRILVLKSR